MQTCIPKKSSNLKKINELMELLLVVVATSNETENDLDIFSKGYVDCFRQCNQIFQKVSQEKTLQPIFLVYFLKAKCFLNEIICFLCAVLKERMRLDCEQNLRIEKGKIFIDAECEL